MLKVVAAVMTGWLGLCLLAIGQSQAATPLRIAHTSWSSSVASANLMCVLVREKLGQPCQLQAVDAEGMWRSVAEGEADVMLSAWLPDTHAHYLQQFGDRLEDLGPNLEGTRTGLVVPAVRVGRQTGGMGMRNPDYITAESIADLAGHAARFNRRIIGIDAGAGVMRETREALEAYGLDDFRLIEGSEQSMTRALSHAIQRQEWIVVTGWVPHWMFDRWSLRFLEDPKAIYGDAGRIHTLARPGLKAEQPRVHTLLDRFHWSPADMDRLLIWIHQDHGLDPYGKAERWVRTNPATVEQWLVKEAR